MDLIPFSLTGHCLENYFIKITSRSKVIYWIIILIVISGIAILPFIYVDVSVLARGYFQSEIEKQIVLTPFAGKIVYASIKSGDSVSKGDTLIIIDSEALRAQQIALMQRISENDSSIRDLEKLTKIDGEGNLPYYKPLNTQRYIAEYDNLRNQVSIQFQKYQKQKSEHKRNELLYNQQLIPATDFENSLFLLVTERDNLNQLLAYQKSVWQSDLSMRRIESVTLNADLNQYTEGLSNRILLAPISGEIIQSADIQPGSQVTAGQQVAEISPGGDLVATCFVKPSDIGLLHENQNVKIQVDAFNYTEWGILTGNIIDISDDIIVEDGETAFFRIRCKPDQTFLSLKNGHKAYVKKGMSLNTRIIVIRRSLFNLLFDKADKWFNPYTDNLQY